MKSSHNLSIAFDLGTTTIAGSLLAHGSGERLATAGGLNPQREFGADVISRLAYACKSPANLQQISLLVNAELKRLTEELLEAAGASHASLRTIAVAGNPAMEHLLLGLPVESIAFPPYRPIFSDGRRISPAEMGWGGDADIYLFPLPGGFVGGDTVAFLYSALSSSTRLDPAASSLCLDMGTNGEIALLSGGKIYATSAAAGPAFEGGNLACGMAALPGAVDGVSIAGDRVLFSVIGGKRPRGICGSGVIQLVSSLLGAGVLDSSGRLLSPTEIGSNLANHVREMNGQLVFSIYRDAEAEIYLSQNDIRQFQLAKSAIRAGVEVLFARAGSGDSALQEVVLTGSFGATLDPVSLKNIGIFTEKMVKISGFVRDGALTGVEKFLSTPDGLGEVERLSQEMKVIPLSGTPAFERLFLENMDFPNH